MYKVTLVALLLAFFHSAQCQTPAAGKLTGFKDGYGNEFTYTGELKNGKPSGKGLAVYKSNSKQKYFGDFLNGTFNGKGTLYYGDGRIASGNWQDGKCLGNLVFVSAGQDIYYGVYGKDFFDGPTCKIETANGIVIANYKGTKLNGRVIYVGPNARSFNDNIYVDGDKTGQGYQFDLDQKKLFQGTWVKDVWQSATTNNYASFMRSNNFSGESNDKRTLYRTNMTTEKNLLEDTCFVYLKDVNERYFGNYHLGKLVSGIKTYGDSGRSIAAYDDKGLQGLGLDFVKKRFLCYGNYKNNLLEGDGLYIDLISDFFYNGQFAAGKFTGKAAKLNSYNEITLSNFLLGKANGSTRIIQADGSNVLADYKEGELISTKEVWLVGGEKVNPNPTSAGVAVNELIRFWKDEFTGIESFDVDETVEDNFDFEYQAYYTWYSFPGAKHNVVLEKDNVKSFYMETAAVTNFDAFKKSYDKLCKDVAATTITSLEKGKPFKLKGAVNSLIPNFSGEQETRFTVQDYTGSKPLIQVKATHRDKDYILSLEILSEDY